MLFKEKSTIPCRAEQHILLIFSNNFKALWPVWAFCDFNNVGKLFYYVYEALIYDNYNLNHNVKNYWG